MWRTGDSLAPIMSWRTALKGGCLAAVFALAVVLLSGCDADEAAPPEPAAQHEQPAETLRAYCDRVLGQQDAAITVQTVLPVSNGCQDGIGLYLAALADDYPELFTVQIHDMKSDRGHAVMLANGINCAAVLVDGSTRFDLGPPHGKVLLEGPMDPMDIYRVLCMKARAAGRDSLVLPVPDIEDAPSADQRRKAGF